MRPRNPLIPRLILSATLGCALMNAAQGAVPARRPNFVFIFTDDQRWDAMSVVQAEHGEKARFPWIQTPNMDRMAKEGVRFRNAFVVNSLCSPSRASFMTGCYGHLNGVVNNHTDFPVDSVTYASVLRQAGYRTGYVGKWHMGQQSGQRPGFDFSASFVGQGKYMDYPFEVNGVSTPTHGWVDDVTTDYALNFIRESKDKPFVLAVGFKSPHGPCTPPARLQTFYGQQQARTVPNLSIPAICLNDPGYSAARPTPAGWKKENMDYHRTIRGVDEELGRIFGELDKLGLAEDTMVIFTSDNGLFHGEHRLGDKRAAYEESLRVPMLVRYPKLHLKGKLIDTAVLNIDIAETMLDYAGAKIPSTMQGRSWRPLLEGNEAGWRRAFFYTYFMEKDYPRLPTMMAVRNEAAKLVKYPGHDEWTELFDLKADPYEVKNLFNSPDAQDLRRDMLALYEKQSQGVRFQIPSFADNPANLKQNKGAAAKGAKAAKPAEEEE